jgi:putative ABC transport system permease protein
MFKNYFKIALRRMLRQKMNTRVNILGLSVGIATSIVIFLFAHNELPYDQFNTNADQIYLIYKERLTPTGTQITRDIWLPMAEALKNEYAAITNTVRVWDSDEWVELGNQKFEENITYADPQLFDVFTFPLFRGNRDVISSDIHSAVISQEIAQKYFGDEDPVGKTIQIAFETDYIVRGVLAKIPQNSSIQINIMVSPRSAPYYERNANRWDSSWIYTFLQLKPNTPKEELESQFAKFITKTWGEEENQRTNLKLLALTDFHNETTGSRSNAYLLLIVAFVVLAIASINFMNLTTARSLERARAIRAALANPVESLRYE